jgi:hypothetical protein
LIRPWRPKKDAKRFVHSEEIMAEEFRPKIIAFLCTW